MAVTRINNNQVSSATTGNVAAGINAAVKIQAYSVVSQNLANDIVIGNSLTVTGNIATANILTDGYYWANGDGIDFSSLNYSNANVANYLPLFNGSLYPGEIITDGYYWGNGAPVLFGNNIGGITLGDQQFTGDGSNSTFLLNQSSNPDTIIVSINGVSQYPNLSYTTDYTNSTITFATTPLNTDLIDIRFLGSANQANLVAGNIFSNGYYWANGAPFVNGNITVLNGIILGDQQFYGNGATTYPMSSASSASAVVVSINGTVQAPIVAYTTDVANSTITFSNPVVSGDEVDIRYFGANASQYGDANVIALLDGGTLTTDIITSGNINGDVFTGASFDAVGNITASYLFGNGAFLTGITTTGGGAASYLRAQNTSGWGQNITAIPSTVVFQGIQASAGNSISYSGGTFTLQANQTYQLRGTIGGFGNVSEGPPFVRYQWFDITNGVELGSIARVDSSNPGTQNFLGSAGGTAEAIVTPTTNIDVQLIIISNGTGDVNFTIGGDFQGDAFGEVLVLNGGSSSSTTTSGNAAASTVGAVGVATLGTLSIRLNGTQPQIYVSGPAINLVISGTTNNSGTLVGQNNSYTLASTTWTALGGSIAASVSNSAQYTITDTTNEAVYQLNFLVIGANTASLTIQRLI